MTLTSKDKRALQIGLSIQLKDTSLQEYKSFTKEADKYLQTIFLDWFNNFLTYEKFAEHYEISIERAEKLIEEARTIHERLVKETITTKLSKELGASKKFLDEKIIFIQG